MTQSDPRSKRKPPLIEPAFFDLAGASTYLGGALSVRTLRRLIGNGELAYFRHGRGKIMLKKDDLDRFMASCRCEAVNLDALADEALKELGVG